MSNKILEGMTRAYLSHFGTFEPQAADKLAMRFALLWLADNVSDAIGLAAGKCRHGSNAVFEQEIIGSYRLAISAALRQAAGGGE